jgi:hypothetical protein
MTGPTEYEEDAVDQTATVQSASGVSGRTAGGAAPGTDGELKPPFQGAVDRGPGNDTSQDPTQPPVGPAIQFEELVVPDDGTELPGTGDKSDTTDQSYIINVYEHRLS